MNEGKRICVLCGGEALLRYEKMKGYIEDSFFDVYECSMCDATFVDPLKSDAKIYEYIYKQVETVPGYERYYRYSKLVEQVKNPIKLLANAESAYWSVYEALNKNFPNKEGNFLEIGSGLGYLTYSLNKGGYKTTGLDISKDAVARANARYGNYYEAGDLFEWSTTRKGQYDCVIMMEIIEHVEDPKRFLEAAFSLVKKGGKLILTTPNKSDAPQGTIWQSDFPPVHLWFMSEKTISYLASALHSNVEFIDFTNYTKKFYGPSYFASIEQIQVGLPRLTKDGLVREGTEPDTTKTKLFGLLGRYYLSYIRRRLKRKNISKRTTTLCAVFGS